MQRHGDQNCEKTIVFVDLHELLIFKAPKNNAESVKSVLKRIEFKPLYRFRLINASNEG
jgi:hypothetical protein